MKTQVELNNDIKQVKNPMHKKSLQNRNLHFKKASNKNSNRKFPGIHSKQKWAVFWVIHFKKAAYTSNECSNITTITLQSKFTI